MGTVLAHVLDLVERTWFPQDTAGAGGEQLLAAVHQGRKVLGHSASRQAAREEPDVTTSPAMQQEQRAKSEEDVDIGGMVDVPSSPEPVSVKEIRARSVRLQRELEELNEQCNGVQRPRSCRECSEDVDYDDGRSRSPRHRA